MVPMVPVLFSPWECTGRKGTDPLLTLPLRVDGRDLNTCIYTPFTLSALIPTQGKQYKHLDNSDVDTISFAVGLKMSEVNNVSLT